MMTINLPQTLMMMSPVVNKDICSGYVLKTKVLRDYAHKKFLSVVT